MSRPQQQQQSVMDTLNADLITKNKLSALVEFRGQWYRVEEGTKVTGRSLHFFDTVVILDGNSYNVVKDRRGNRQGYAGFLDVLKVKLFAEGKTLADLPKYYEETGELPGGPLNLHMDHEGNLVAMEMPNDYDATN